MTATATTAKSSKGTARVAVIALAFVVGAAVAGVATGNLLQQVVNQSSDATVLSTEAYRSLHALRAAEQASSTGMAAALATEAYGHQHVARAAAAAGAPAISDWPDLGARIAAPKLISDTFRFTGPSRIQSVGLAAALATEAYGDQHVERMGAGDAAAITDWPDLGSRMVAPEQTSDTFRLTGGSRVE